MFRESLAVSSLAETRYRRMLDCADVQRRTAMRPTYALRTALELQGIEPPRGASMPGGDRAVVAVVDSANERRHVRRLTLVTWSAPLGIVTVERRFTCTSPACTWAMYASRLTLEELVVLGDSMMRRDGRLRRATVDDFLAYLRLLRDWSQDHGRRMFAGYRTCLHALPLMREQTDSSQETRTRLALMRQGLDCPQVNYPLALPGGRCLLLDMAYPEYRVCIEYEGAHHAGQWMDDVQRRQAIEDAEWRYVQVTWLDLGDESSEKRLAERVAARIVESAGVTIPLHRRSLGDGRTLRRMPWWQKLGAGRPGQ